MSTRLYRWLLELELETPGHTLLMKKLSAAEPLASSLVRYKYTASPAEAMASSGGAVAAMLKNNMLVACVMLLVVLLMATQMGAAVAGDAGAGRRRLLDACQYRNCNCRPCYLVDWGCGLCGPPA
uniref:Uncharacterized protein n=1 Tax=Aegilops tauschii TaxID=37682 RepID=M8AQS9_AEGTA